MLINDGGGITDPLNVKKIKGIDELLVYERAIVQPDYTALFYGEPQYYQVSSISGFFQIHKSRCLVFRNGILPERTLNPQLRYWGIPEYQRISHELRECSTSHGHAVKMLERSVQPIYKMKDLQKILSSLDGESAMLDRLHAIDTARSILNSIAIDSDGEDYDFKTIQLTGVKDIIDTTYNMLSAVMNIPQAILFGRSPAGMNSTGQSDLENYYNLIERIQKMMLRGNLKTLVDIIFRAALAKGEIAEKPKYKIEFNPLWSLSDTEQATVNQSKAIAAQTRAATAQIYVDMGALDPSEVRKGLADDGEFDIEKMLDDFDDTALMEGFGNSIEDEPLQEETAPETHTPEVVINKDENDLTNSAECGIMNTDDAEPQFITVNGAAVPIDDNGGLGGKVGDKIEKGSGSEIENHIISEFKGNSGVKHFEKRQNEGHYKNLTLEQYQTKAKELLAKEIGGDIDGYATPKGKIVRWDKATNDYATSKDGKDITTLFPLRGGQARFEKLRELDMKEKS